MISTVLFDLDGTLLPMDNETFTKYYFSLLCQKMAPHGYDADELVKAVWAGTSSMVKNDGSETNESVFWKAFSAVLGEGVLQARPVLEEFYQKEFNGTKAACGYNPQLVDLVRDLKGKGYRVALATNPIFPALATESRIRWAGFDPSEFELVTTYENIGYCKPNPEYYREILRRLNVSADETAMIGNDATEDAAAKEAGIQVFLLTDCLINKANADITAYPHGHVEDLRKWLL